MFFVSFKNGLGQRKANIVESMKQTATPMKKVPRAAMSFEAAS